MAQAVTNPKQQAHELIDRISAAQASAVVGLLEAMPDPVSAALSHFAATGEGDAKRIQDIEPPEFACASSITGFASTITATPCMSLPSSIAAKPTASLEHSAGDTADLSLVTAAVSFVLAGVFNT